jgi:hypothetical protein
MKLNPVGERNLDRSLQLETGNSEEGILLKRGMVEVGENKHVHFILPRRAGWLRFSKHVVVTVKFNGN